MTAAPSADASDVRARLLRFYAKYAPEKSANIDKILTAYVGNEEKLIQDLVAKYGPEPPASSPSPDGNAKTPTTRPPSASTDAADSDNTSNNNNTADGIRRRLVRFYAKYAPERLENIDRIMEHYRGKEDRILPDLVKKYGPEPPADAEDARSAPSSSTGGDATRQHDTNYFRGRLTRLYQRYAPDKQANIDTILKRYEGKEEEVLAELVKKYGPEPASSEGSAPSPAERSLRGDDYRSRLVRFLEHYAPEKASQADAMLAKYAGKEADMMKALVAKFGPEVVGPNGASTPPGASTATANNYLARVENILKAHAPDKLNQANAMLTTYSGRELELIEALVKKLGPEPSPPPPPEPIAAPADGPTASSSISPTSAPATDYASRLTRLMEAHAPDRVGQVASLLAKYTGREEEMFTALVAKLGPEPTTTHTSKALLQGEAVEQSAAAARLDGAIATGSCQDLLRSWIGEKGLEGFRQHSIVATSVGQVVEGSPRAPAVDNGAMERLCLLAVCIERDAQLQPLLAATTTISTAPPQPPMEGKLQLATSVFHALQVNYAAGGGSQSDGGPTTKLPRFLDADGLIDTALRARSVVQLCQQDVQQCVQTLDADVSSSIEAITAWARSDAQRIRQLVVDRMYHQRLVIERALGMIASVETNIRADLWRVREIEAQGRWMWFKERRREISLLAKPPQLQAVEHMFDRWKDLVAEQHEAIVDGDIAHRISERFGHVHSDGHRSSTLLVRSSDAAVDAGGVQRPWSPDTSVGALVPTFRTPLPTAARAYDAAQTAVSTPRNAAVIARSGADKRQHQHYDAVCRGSPRSAAASTTTPRRDTFEEGRRTAIATPRSIGGRRGSPHTPSPRTPRRRDPSSTAIPRLGHRPDACEDTSHAFDPPKAWNQSTPRRTLSEHPSKAHVTSAARHLPPKLHIGTTIVRPFSFSSPAATSGSRMAKRSPGSRHAYDEGADYNC